MIKNLTVKFLKNMSKDVELTDEKFEQIEFVLRVLTFEVIKISVIIIFLGLLGYLKESLIIIVTMTSTKPFLGGYHEDTQFKCFIATLTIVSSIIILSGTTDLNFYSCIILNLFSIFSIYNQAPIINKNFPITKEILIKRNRILSLITSCFLALTSLIFFKTTWVSQPIVWTLLIQALLLFNKYEKKEI